MSDEALLAPFAGWVVRPEWADRVIARAYDTVSPDERRALAAANPYSYVNVTRSPEDVPPGEARSADELIAEGVAAFERLLEADAFAPTGRPALYLYRMTTHGRSQTGVVGTVPVAALIDRRIRLHENVRDDRTALLARHSRAVGATSSPIALTFRGTSRPGFAALVAELTIEEPDLDLLAHLSDVRHEIWTVPAERSHDLAELFQDCPLYLTDGHHRAAAAVAVAAESPGDPVRDRTLAIVFPDDHLHIDPFHRVVRDAGGRNSDQLLTALRSAVAADEVPDVVQARPARAGEVAMYFDGRWYHFELPEAVGSTPLDRLDVERLRVHVLDPVLGADELGQTGSVEYVSDPTGIDEVVRRCDAGGKVGFVVHPTSIAELMAVADARQLMPPKSSYVAPKPVAGVFLRILGTGATADLPPS